MRGAHTCLSEPSPETFHHVPPFLIDQSLYQGWSLQIIPEPPVLKVPKCLPSSVPLVSPNSTPCCPRLRFREEAVCGDLASHLLSTPSKLSRALLSEAYFGGQWFLFCKCIITGPNSVPRTRGPPASDAFPHSIAVQAEELFLLLHPHHTSPPSSPSYLRSNRITLYL